MKCKYHLIIIVIIIFIFAPTRDIFTQTTQIATESSSSKPPNNNVFDQVSGSFTLRYRGRHAEGDGRSDQDFYESLRLSYVNPNNEKISGYLSGALCQDIDDPSTLFRSIDDTHDFSLRGYLYELYANVNDIGIIETAKIGRQYSYDVENLHFDGLHLRFKPFHNLRFATFAGIPVHLQESSSDGDWMSGISVEIKPLENSTVRFDYVVSSDNSDDNIGNHHDNLFVVSAWHNIKQWWRVYGRFSKLDSISRDLQIRSFWNFPSLDLNIQFSYYKQAQRLGDFTIEFNEFVPSMGNYEAYDQYSLDIYKGIGSYMGINIGAGLRELKDESDENVFNNDFERYYITYSLFDYPLKGLTTTLTGEDYETAGDDIQSISFDFTHNFSKNFKISLGTYYSLYKYDTTSGVGLTVFNSTSEDTFFPVESLTESERDNVRSYYLKVKKRIFDNWEIRGKYEYENFDSEIFHTFQTTLKIKF